MKITIICTLMFMLAYFLILYGGVGFIQDKKFFSSAPPQVLQVVPDKKERFKGALIVGWIIIIIAFSLFIGSVILASINGINNNFTFIQFLIRFLIILYGMEIYDIFFFDWVLLCHSNFYPYFYPEVKNIVGPHLFGFNKETHLIHFLIYIPICIIFAYACTLL